MTACAMPKNSSSWVMRLMNLAISLGSTVLGLKIRVWKYAWQKLESLASPAPVVSLYCAGSKGVGGVCLVMLLYAGVGFRGINRG